MADELFAQGLSDSSLLADLGAGACDFDFYLRCVRGWKGRYLPVDASIDGTNFDAGWYPRVSYDFITAIELLEHIQWPNLLVENILCHARVAFVATTPNTDVLGEEYVRKIDRTHCTPLYQSNLKDMGASVITVASFFGRPNDSLLAVWNMV